MTSGPRQRVEAILSRADGAPELAFLKGHRIVRELGRGGFGAVFLLADAEQQTAAIKIAILDPRVEPRYGDPMARRKFLREIDIAKAVHHPNVVAYGGSGSTDEGLFFTMEYCAGGSVGHLVTTEGRLPAGRAVRIISQALDGLHHMHTVDITAKVAGGEIVKARGLVHRDVKPDNLLLASDAPDAIVKVADYGMSKAFETAGWSGITATGQAAGTPIFMPRVQLVRFRDAKPEVDVWATAACLYWMLTLEFPRHFPASARGAAMFDAVMTEPVVPIRSRLASVPTALADVLDAALAETPSLRFASAADFKQALAAACP
jgi:eukaryotic-like serine/threonine-protein kinase